MASRLGSYAETALSTSPEAHAKRRLLARTLLGNDSSTAAGRDIQESVRKKMEEDEAKRRQGAVWDHVPPPKNVGLQDTAGLAMEEKAAKMFPTMVEELRRKAGLAPYSQPGR